MHCRPKGAPDEPYETCESSAHIAASINRATGNGTRASAAVMQLKLDMKTLIALPGGNRPVTAACGEKPWQKSIVFLASRGL